uniref:ZM domain-containing protein n=1 Tax=Heterorhabditis bacteriophora TaxID=37862 RepID=A0A1I7WMZ2_HETBA
MHGQSSLTNRITTFPVCSQRTLSDSRKSFLPSDLPRFQLPMGRPSLTHFPSRTALPQYNQISRGPASISAGRLPTQTDPHMEALLDYYKEQTATRKPPTPKTATIV